MYKNKPSDELDFFKELHYLCQKHNMTIGGFDDGLTFYFANYDIQPLRNSYNFGEETEKQLEKLIDLQKRIKESCE